MLLSCEKKVSEVVLSEKNNMKLVDTIPYSKFIDSVEIDSDEFSEIKKELYEEKKINPMAALKKADSLIKQYSENYKKTKFSYNVNKIEDLHFLKGEIFYEKKDFQICAFTFSHCNNFYVCQRLSL